MKILYIITKSNWGGAQRHVFDLAVAMKAKNHDVYVALGGEGLLKQKLESAGIYTFPISTLGRDISVSKDASSFKEIFDVIKNKKPDIVHLHSPKAGGLGALAGRILRVKKIIYTVHGWTFNETRPLHQKLGIILVSWITMLLTHKTILLSAREYTQALHFPWVKERLSLIPLGIKPPVFMSVDGAKQFLGKMIGLSVQDLNKKTVVGTIAELHPNKGLTYLVNAMKSVVQSLPNTICIIIGDGQEKENLRALIQEKKLENNIFMTGYVDNASEYLKAFNVFILPSLKEGLPYAILESGCASLPVVSTTVGGIPEMIEDMKSGILIQPKSVRELSHAISYMVEHPEDRRKFGSTLKEQVVSKFGLERMVGDVEKVYNLDN